MRKVLAVEMLSLDGVMESPEEWAFSYSDEEMGEASASGMAASDALLMGRDVRGFSRRLVSPTVRHADGVLHK